MSTFKKFKKTILDQTTVQDPVSVARTINLLQNSIEDSLTPIITKQQNDSILLTNQALIIGVNTISHKLGQNLSGWKLIDINAAAHVWRVNSSSNPGLFLYLQTDAPCTVSLEVF